MSATPSRTTADGRPCHTSYVSDNIIFQLFPWNYHAHVLFFVSTEDLCTSVHLFCGLSLHPVINAHTYCAYIVTLELIRAAICIALSITINSSGNYCCFLVLNLNNQMNRKGNSKGERMVTIIQLTTRWTEKATVKENGWWQ
jgi:hypothetical protein